MAGAAKAAPAVIFNSYLTHIKSENFNPIFKPKLISDTNFYALPVSLSTFLSHAATLREGILFSLNCQLPDEVEGTFILVELSKSSTS